MSTITSTERDQRIGEITARMHELTANLTRLGNHERLTRAQEIQLAETSTEFDTLTGELHELQLDRVRAAANGENGGRRIPAVARGDYGDADRYDDGPTRGRDGAMRTLDKLVRSNDLPAEGAERAESVLVGVRAHEGAEWVRTTGSPEYLSAFLKLVQDPTTGHRLWTEPERVAFGQAENVRAAMSLTDANGGYMVPLQLDPTIMLTSAGTIDPMRSVARQVVTASDSWQGVTSAGVTAEWLAEAAEAADASPTLAGPSIPTFKGSAFVPFSYEVGMDALSFAQELTKLLVDGYQNLQATAFVTGNGTTAPQGFVTGLAAAGGAAVVAPTTAETFAAADVYKLLEAVPARFRANASWMANLTVLNLIDQFETTAGAKKFPELDNNRLLRKPVFEASEMDGAWNTAATAANYILACGDFRQGYIIVDRIGTQVELISNLVGANRRPIGSRGMFLWGRVGGQLVNSSALRVLNLATTA